MVLGYLSLWLLWFVEILGSDLGIQMGPWVVVRVS